MSDNLNAGYNLFQSLKNKTFNINHPLVIPVGFPVRGLLRPIITAPGHLDPVDVHLLTEWRNRTVKSYLSEFVATRERTAFWLENIIHKDKCKMLFMVESLNRERLGHVGLGFINWEEQYGEADAIVSCGKSPHGLMKESLQALLNWAINTLSLTELVVRVRSDNDALNFYNKVGFYEFKRVPLRMEKREDGVYWEEDPSILNKSGLCLVYMRY